MLEGKAKELFDKWMRPSPLEHGRFGQLVTNTFDNIPLSMQFGVIQDFADSLRIVVSVDDDVNNVGYYYDIDEIDKSIERHVSEIYDTRHQAREQAITKLNELINKR